MTRSLLVYQMWLLISGLREAMPEVTVDFLGEIAASVDPAHKEDCVQLMLAGVRQGRLDREVVDRWSREQLPP